MDNPTRVEATEPPGNQTIMGDSLDRLEAHVREAQTAAADATARLESERAASMDKITLLQQAQEQLKDAFARLSTEALQRSNQQFLELADTRFKQAGAPLTETLGKVEVQLREIEKSRAGAQQALVDSKVTLSAYLEAHDATDDVVREERLTAHARHLRTHVDQLAAKAYWSQFSAAPEFVVLFVPGDAFLAAALDHDADLLDYAFGKRIHIATPTTLISVLRTCAYAWQQEALAANAREVFDLGRELYKRLGVMGSHMHKLGRSLTSSVDNYNKTIGSFEKNVLVTARRLNALEVTDFDLESPTTVDEPIRQVAAAELVAAVEEERTIVALPAATDAHDVVERAEDYALLSESTDKDGRATG